MKNDVFENSQDRSDSLVESLGFVGFDPIDLLRFIESEMGAGEEAAFLEQVRSGDVDAARRLARMKQDHDVMHRVPEPVPGRDLLASVRSRIARGELIEDQLFADPGLEPTVLMSKSIDDLARRRRRDRRRPFEWAAAGITVAMLAGILGSHLVDRFSGVEFMRVAGGDFTTEPGENRETSVESGAPTEEIEKIEDSVQVDPRPAVLANSEDGDRTSSEELQRKPASNLASFGLAVVGDGGEAFESRLASLVHNSNAVLIRNLTLVESIGAAGREFMAGLRRPSGRSGSSTPRGTLQPPPIVGMSEGIPDSKIRIDLAERGFRYAIVVPRAEVEGILARLSGLSSGNAANAGAWLIPAQTEEPNAAIDLDAWSSWSQQAQARPRESSRSATLIVPIAVVPEH
jgi:hypothetical protein